MVALVVVRVTGGECSLVAADNFIPDGDVVFYLVHHGNPTDRKTVAQVAGRSVPAISANNQRLLPLAAKVQWVTFKIGVGDES